MAKVRYRINLYVLSIKDDSTRLISEVSELRINLHLKFIIYSSHEYIECLFLNTFMDPLLNVHNLFENSFCKS